MICQFAETLIFCSAFIRIGFVDPDTALGTLPNLLLSEKRCFPKINTDLFGAVTGSSRQKRLLSKLDAH